MSASSSPRPSYAAVLRIPHARRTFLAALVGRLCYGVVSVAVMLSVTRATGSYAVAGTVMALFGATGVFLMPYRAALVDRYGPRRALTPMALLYAALLCVLAAATWRPGTPAVALGVIAAVTGACAPPLGPTMRAVWAELVPERGMLQRAYGLDGVAEELLFVTGPLLVGVVVGFASPAAGVLLSAVLMAVGTLAFVTSPAVGGVRAAHRDSGPESRPGAGPKSPRKRESSPVDGRALLQPVVVATGVGLSLSVVDLLVVAFAEQRHLGADSAAWVLAALSAGSAVGGLLNGAVDWRTPARVRLPRLAVGLGLALAAAGLAPGLWTLAAAVACAGVFVAPALTTAYLLADETAAPGARTRAGAWINTGVNAGSSGGAMAAGLLIGRLPLGACFVVAGVAVLAPATLTRRPVSGWGRRHRNPVRLERPQTPDGQPAADRR
ncbi:MFS transporter [Streptomyces pseudovenezuelae]|uniref:MFS family permease n=1 Tax=Streptomyces pseudovenezuelae TaxID=67350 RepID=A0ABT6LWQ5_9ACTN|nr:MFS transporter [Streptomyces pseudovenezuelae]MDH6219854.1 MFS family permease [Streptomyces pseudovenezuelae]